MHFSTERSETTRPRIIETGPENHLTNANIGENVTLWCMFDVGGTQTGLVDLTMNWRKNGSIVNDTDHTAWDVDTSVDNNQMFYLNITNITVIDCPEIFFSKKFKRQILNRTYSVLI